MDKYSDALNRIKKFNDDRDWSQFHDSKNLALSLVLESSEVLELFQWTQNNELKDGKESQLPEELADVFYWCLLLASKHNINLFDALEEKMKHNEEKYPIKSSKGDSRKYNEK